MVEVSQDKTVTQERDGARSKRLWQQPRLTFLGELGDLVQGLGKTGPASDADPTFSQKQGVG